MGNDGGSIPDRRDLVKTKAKAEQADKNNQTIAAWFFCALSKKDLEEPIVSCELGKLYNKEAIIEYLVNKSAYGDGDKICGHIRSIKDVKTLKLTPNPSKRAESDADLGKRHAKYICPLTLREMSGQTPFVYITTCGDVFSAAGLKTLFTSETPSSSTPSSAGEDGTSVPCDICPQCGVKFHKVKDVRAINPVGEQATQIREAMLTSRAAAKAAKAAKKRKAEEPTTELGVDAALETKKSKKTKVDDANADQPTNLPAPSTNGAFSAVNKKVVQQLAEEEKRRKSNMSTAVASLYQKKDSKAAKETFLTMNTFTRYA